MTKWLLVSFFTMGMCFADSAFSRDISKEISEAANERNYKKAIAIKKEEVELSSQTDKSLKLKELALLYLKDQDQEKAFASFLAALDTAPKGKEGGSEDVALYEKAFNIYMDPSNNSPQITAQKLLEMLKPAVEQHPNQLILHYFIAIAYANQNRFDDFFNHFYTAYTFNPDHYLAYKTKAVLHIKLLERTRGEEDRSRQKREIKRQLEEALKREPRDVTIYRLLISFSPKEEKEEQVRRSLNKIIHDNIMVPRSDLMFYVQEAIDSGERNLAADLLQKSREWYPESRLVREAQTYLDAHK